MINFDFLLSSPDAKESGKRQCTHSVSILGFTRELQTGIWGFYWGLSAPNPLVGSPDIRLWRILCQG